MNKNIIFVFNEMSIGGSTTSLLSILRYMNPENYNIDLLLLKGKGELIESVPEYVQMLPHVFSKEAKKRTMPKRAVLKLYGKVLEKIRKKPEIVRQTKDRENVIISNATEGEYDIAIAFEEGFPTYYMMKKVRAKKKIAWIHTDYKAAGFWEKLDKSVYDAMDKIVLVSDVSKKSYNEIFPEHRQKTVVIENMLSPSIIFKRAEEKEFFDIDRKIINFITVCRIDFISKGLDRGVKAFANMKKENKDIGVKWYIIGTGPDSKKMKKMIEKSGLQKEIEMLGEKKNPLPFVKEMDIFLLPSRFEGKPMAVTEAQILGIPPVVTEYASAHDQINSGLDGLVAENSEESIESALRYIIKCPEKISFWKENLKKRNFENGSELQKIIKLFEAV